MALDTSDDENQDEHDTPIIQETPLHDNDTRLDIDHTVDLFLRHACHHFPFIHRPTFDRTESPRFLLLAMASLGYQYHQNLAERSSPFNLGKMDLSRRCYREATRLIRDEERTATQPISKLTIVQAYLVLQTCGLVYLGGREAMEGTKIHFRMINVSQTLAYPGSSDFQ